MTLDTSNWESEFEVKR